MRMDCMATYLMRIDEDGLDANELDEDSRGADSICEVIGCGANWTEWWINYLTTNSNKLNHFIFTLISNDIPFGTEILAHISCFKKSPRNRTVQYPYCKMLSLMVHWMGEALGNGHISYLSEISDGLVCLVSRIILVH